MTQTTTDRSRAHRSTRAFCTLLLALIGLATLQVQVTDPVAAVGTVLEGPVASAFCFKGPFAKASVVKITVLENGRVATTQTDARGAYQVPTVIDGVLVHVAVDGKFFDERTGKITKTPITLTAIDSHDQGDRAPQVNVISHLVAARVIALAGDGSRGPFVNIVVPAVFPEARASVQESLEDALNRMPRGSVLDLNPKDEGSRGQAQVIHVSLVVTEAAYQRSRATGVDQGTATQSLLNDMVRDIANLGRFSPEMVTELRTAEQTMDGAAMLRNLHAAYGIGGDLIDDYRP